ncbi:MAG TPA: hypothetical protein VNJ01_02055 [Bacteriovoracaceae bacterium]|nr:hypothetical protein [Bacteriovoracaceae bacterium]
MRKLFFILMLLPVLAQADFKERDYLCKWEIGPYLPSLDAGLFNVSRIRITRNTLTFGYLNDYGEEEDLVLDSYRNITGGRLFTATGALPIKIGEEPTVVSTILLQRGFYLPYDRNGLGLRFIIVTKQGDRIINGRGSCQLAHQN